MRVVNRFFSNESKNSAFVFVVLSLFLGFFFNTFLSQLVYHFDLYFGKNLKELSGSDLTISSTRPFSEEDINWLISNLEASSQSVRFPSVARFGENFESVAVFGVEENFPLSGNLSLNNTPLPKPDVSGNQAWVDESIAKRLGLSKGSLVELGNVQFKIAGIFSFVPESSGGFASLFPKLLIPLNSVSETGLITQNSRVRYSVYGTASREQSDVIESFYLENQETGMRFRTIYGDAGDGSGDSLRKIWSILIGVLLIGFIITMLALSLAGTYYCKQRYRDFLRLHAFGLRRSYIIWQMWWMLVRLFVVSVGIAVVLSLMLSDYAVNRLWGSQIGEFISLFNPLFLANFVALSAVVIVNLMYPIWKLVGQSPGQILREQDEVVTKKTGVFWYLLGCFACFSLWIGFVYREFTTTFGFFVAFAGAWLLLSCLAFVFFAGLPKLLRRFSTSGIRIGLHQLKMHLKWHSLSLGYIVLIASMMQLVFFLRGDLKTNWLGEIDDKLGVFLLNVEDEDRKIVETELAKTLDFFPVVRGRLEAKNGVDFKEIFPDPKDRGEPLDRELSLTALSSLPADNIILEGQYHGTKTFSGSDVLEVSVEEGVAQTLDLGLGDRVSFSIGGLPLEAQVTSIREVDWGNLSPNFYFIFPESSLDSFFPLYMSFVESYSGIDQNLRELFAQVPTIAILDLREITGRIVPIISAVLDGLSYLSGFFLVFVLLIGVLMCFVTASVRFSQFRLSLWLGLSPQRASRATYIEFCILACVAVVCSSLISLGIHWFISQQILDLSYSFHAGIFVVSLLCLFVYKFALAPIALKIQTKLQKKNARTA